MRNPEFTDQKFEAPEPSLAVQALQLRDDLKEMAVPKKRADRIIGLFHSGHPIPVEPIQEAIKDE